MWNKILEKKYIAVVASTILLTNIALFAFALPQQSSVLQNITPTQNPTQSESSSEKVTYTYPRYRDEMHAGDLADEIKTALGYKLKADFEGDKVDGAVTVNDKDIVITMPKLDAQQKGKLDQIVAQHYSAKAADKIAKMKQRLESLNAQEFPATEHVLARNGLQAEDTAGIYHELMQKLGNVASVEIRGDSLVVTTYGPLDESGKNLLENAIGSAIQSISPARLNFNPEPDQIIPTGNFGTSHTHANKVASGTTFITTTSTSFVDVSNLSYSITTSTTSDFFHFLSIEANNDVGRIDFRIQNGGTATPIDIFLFGKDPSAEHWIRTLHGMNDLLSSGTRTVKAQWKVSSSTGEAQFRILSTITFS